MTISTEVRKAGPFIGNDSASVFPFAFKVFKASDLIVVRRQDNIGEETTLILDSDYHVTLNSNQDTTPGGVVTLVAGALASGFTLVVSSELPYLQPTDLTNQGGFYPKVITNALDRLTIFCQQLLEITGRTLKLPITAPTNISAEIPLPNPSELIAWNETGTGLTTISPQSLVTSIAYGSATADLFAGDGVTTTFPLTTNPASVNNLDVSIGGHSQRPAQGGVGDYSWNGGASITFVVPPPAPTVPGDKNVLVRYMQAIPVSDSEALHAQTREALRRSYAEAGFNLVDGSFETGGALTAATDVMLQESTGAAYAWAGTYPVGGYDVAPGIDPTVVVGFELRKNVALRSELAGDTGANLVWYKRLSGVARSLLSWMFDQPASVKDYGAKVDGVTDDTAAILLAATTAKRIYIPDTGYPAIVDGLVLDGIVGLEIYGPGCLKSKAGSTTRTLKIVNSDSPLVSNLEIDGNRDSRTPTASRNDGAGISFTNCTGWTANRLKVHNVPSGAGILAIDDGSGTSEFEKKSTVKWCHVYDCGKAADGTLGLCDGMFLNQDNMSVHFNYIHDCTDYGIAGDYSSTVSIAYNRIKNVLVGIGVLGATFWDLYFNKISNAGIGIAITLSGNSASFPYVSKFINVYRNWVTDITRAPSGTPNGDAIFVDTSASGVKITHNVVNTAYRGITSDAPGTVMANNDVSNTTDRGIFNGGINSISEDNSLTATGGEYYGSTEANKDVKGNGLKDARTVTVFSGGWSSSTGPYGQAKYYKSRGRIYLDGAINPGTQSANQPIFNLPSGYRPAYRRDFTVSSETGALYVLRVTTAGDVIYMAGTGGTNIQLHQMSFPVA